MAESDLDTQHQRQRRALAQWRTKLLGQALVFGGIAGGLVAFIGAAGDVEQMTAIAPFLGLGCAGLVLASGEAPKF